MAPRRGGRRVVKTTKVVEETVEVSLLEETPQPKLVDSIREERTQSTTTIKSIPVEGEEEPNKMVIPPREEAPAQPRKRGRPKDDTKKHNKGESERKRRKKRSSSSSSRSSGGGEGYYYKRYVFRVMKQVHPGMGISSQAMTVINNLMSDMFEKMAMEASRLNMHGKKKTMTSREIQGAVKLIFPGELGKHAIAEGSKAVSNYITFHKK